jgi:regulator of telomere elongation helicase 1
MCYLFLQEGICADAASFDLPAAHLTACIGEAKQCVDLASARKATDNGADTSLDPDNFAVLKGKSVSPIH